MTDINSVIVCGHLVRDVEKIEYLPNGTPKIEFSIASNRSVKKGEEWISESSFFNVVYFGKVAEALQKILLKGVQVVIEGSLRQDRWEKDGVKNQKIYIVANNIQLNSSARGRTESAPSESTVQIFPENIPF